MPALEIIDITKRYPRTDAAALAGVSFSIEDGEVMVLVGESGSGKTTLLRIICGLTDPDAGEVRIQGETVCLGSRSLVPTDKREVGLVFQDYALFPHLTVQRNILYGLHDIPRSARKARVKEMLALCHLDGLEKRYPHELSGGQQQRVALARALARKPSLLLLDEPFSNLDPMRRDALRDEVQSIVKEANTAALIVTHDTRDALAVADRLMVLKHGELQQVGTPEEIYFHSSNEYTANLFGKVNRIPCQLFNAWEGSTGTSVVWLRPGALEVGDEVTDTEFIVGKVTNVSFQGSHREVTLQCGDGPSSTTVSLYVDPERDVQLGSTLTIRRRQNLPPSARTAQMGVK